MLLRTGPRTQSRGALRLFWFWAHDTDSGRGGDFSLALLNLHTPVQMGTAREHSCRRTSFECLVKGNPERRYGSAMKGSKPSRNLWKEDRVLCCARQVQHDEAFIYEKEANAEHGSTPDQTLRAGCVFQEKASWLAPHRASVTDLSGGTGSRHPLDTCRSTEPRVWVSAKNRK